MLRTIVGYVSPPAGAPSVLQWSDEGIVAGRLAGAKRLECVRRRITFDYPCSPLQIVRLFREWYGPTVRAFAALDERGRTLLERDLVRLWSEHNHAGEDATRVESEYLEVIAIR